MLAFSVSPPAALRTINTRTTSITPRRLPLPATRFHGSTLRPPPPPHTAHSHHHHTPKCYSEAPEDDSEPDEEDEEQIEITLTDPLTNRTLAAGVEHTITSKGNTYVLCYPIDDPVTFATVSDTSVLDPISDDALIQHMFPNAEAVLAEEHIVLKNSAYFLTIDDQSEDLAEGDDDHEEHEEAPYDEGQESQLDEQDVEVIGEFLHEGRHHFVVRPIDAVLLVAEVLDGQYRVLKGEELKTVSPIIEEFIEAAELPAP